MAPLFSTLSWRGKTELDAGNYTVEKPSTRRSPSVRSRMSISSLFNRQNSSQQADCKERTHYPLYDASDPEHHGPPASSVSSDQGERTTPKKTRLQSIAQRIQHTLRAKAAYFYVQHTPNWSIQSPTSSVSKKTVRFRERHSTIGEERQLANSSPASLQNSPNLLRLSFSQMSLLPVTACPNDWCVQRDPGTKTPDVTPIILPSPLCEATTMPSTHLPLEDPFDDIHTAQYNTLKAPSSPECVYLVGELESPSRAPSGNFHGQIEGSCVSPPLSRPQSSHSGTDEDASVLTDVRYSTAMATNESGSHSSKPEHTDYEAAARRDAKSKKLPFGEHKTKVDEADLFLVAAQPVGQENVPMAYRLEYPGKDD